MARVTPLTDVTVAAEGPGLFNPHGWADRLACPLGEQPGGQQALHRIGQRVVVPLPVGPQVPRPRRRRQGVQHGRDHGGAFRGEKTGDRLQHIRESLPCLVRVTAATHPLRGSVLEATWLVHRSGVLYLVVQLPDGSPGTIPASATDVAGGREAAGPAVVLDAAGVRRLGALAAALLAGPAGGRSR